MAINNAGNLVENLKCIGGPNDGKYAYIGQLDRVGDCIRVVAKQKPISVMNLGAISETVVNYNEYTIDCFRFSKDDIYYFLRPLNWTSKKAILHQFNK